MIRITRLIPVLAASILSVGGGATAVDDGDAPANARDLQLAALQQTAGAPISMELNEAGVTRIVSMTPRFPVSGHATDPALAATNFLAAYHDVFQLDRSDLSSFTVVGNDPEPQRNMNHITLQRNYNGIPVFQGVLSIHMDGGNGVFT